MYSSPGIPERDNNTSSSGPYDNLNYTLNSVHEIPYTRPSFNRSVIWTNGDVGLDDRNYSVGYKQVFVDNQVYPMLHSFEAPNVPVTQTPYNQSIFNSTQVQPQTSTKFLQSLRAPGINEGF